MKNLIMLFIAFITLIGCGGGHQQEENTSEWGDSIATDKQHGLLLAAISRRLCTDFSSQRQPVGN